MTSQLTFTDIDNYLDANLRTTSEKAEAAYDDLKKGFDWKRWLLIGEAVSTAHDLAAQSVGARTGRDFNDFMRAYYRLYPKLDQIDKSTRSLAVKCWRERDAIEQWRQSIGQAKALRFNHPTSTWRAFEKSRRAAKPKDTAKPKDSQRKKAGELSPGVTEVERLRATLKMMETMWEDDRRRFSQLPIENAKLKAEVDRLSKEGPPWMKNQLSELRGANYKLRQELTEATTLAKLSPDQHKRYLAWCRRYRRRMRAEVDKSWGRLRELERTVGARTGMIPDPLWRDIVKCLQGTPSDETRNRAFIGMKDREKLLRDRKKTP